MRVGELVVAGAAADIVGRASELAALHELTGTTGLRVAYIHGIPGIGKSTLLRAFAADARDRGATVLVLDCREVEPTPEGFADALASAAGLPVCPAVEIAERLGAAGNLFVLALDSFEAFRLLDTWLRLTFIPVLAGNVRVILTGRHRPAVGWRFGGWEKLVLNLPLAPLAADEATDLLEPSGLAAAQRRRVAAALHGHPLALRLAASVLREQPDLQLPDATLQRVMGELTDFFLAEAGPGARRLLEAASVVRRITVPVLASMFPEEGPEEAYRRLEGMPFTEVVHDGLRLHEAVRDAVAATLHARDPDRYLDYRRNAWRALARQASTVARPELWRYTADMLYLIEHPVVREAFFASGTSQLAVEQALPGDGPAIHEIVAAHEGPQAATCLLDWWKHRPESFVVVRNADGDCAGCCCRLDPAHADPRRLGADPVAAAWRSDLERRPLADGNRALFIRRWLDRSAGERPSDSQAACWLDLKRTYMEMRPDLQRVYLTLADLEPYAAVARELGFRVLDDLAVELDGRSYHTAVLDFGPDSVDGWLADLAATELGIPRQTDLLNRDARELVLDGRHIGLTPLEFGLMTYLCDREARAVSRQELLHGVWHSEYSGWSNKVDAAITGLRHKLGTHARCIETVRGVGYRFRRRPREVE